MGNRLGTVVPREQVGAKTAAAYEFQYGEAALACLELLKSRDEACVYCEWHDDFVIERNPGTPSYEFFQVKSRSAKQGPWPMSEILGVTGKRPRVKVSAPGAHATKKVNKTRKPLELAAEIGIAERLLDHHRKFPGACAAFAVVTTHDVGDDAFTALVEAAGALRDRHGASSTDLDPHARELFLELVAAYQARDSAITEHDVWTLLTRLRIARARGRPGEVDVVIGLMVLRIHEFSEVNLNVGEQRRIAAQLVDRVRAKSQHSLDRGALPGEAEVRAAKAIEIDEVLSLLALSPAGYRELRSGGHADVRAYSRLHRLCRDNGMDATMIQLVCRLRIAWEQWRSENRDNVTEELLLIVRDRGQGLLEQLRASGMRIDALQRAADQAAASLGGVRGLPSIDGRTMMGLVFAIASEATNG